MTTYDMTILKSGFKIQKVNGLVDGSPEDILELIIEGQIMKFLPVGLGKTFPNLEKLVITTEKFSTHHKTVSAKLELIQNKSILASYTWKDIKRQSTRCWSATKSRAAQTRKMQF